MLSGARAQPLSRILAVRMILGALLVAVVLTGTTFTKYLLEHRYLRRETLEDMAATVAADLARGVDPAGRTAFRDYPNAYAFRVFSDRLAFDRRLLAAANPSLLPPLPTDARGHAADLEEKFEEFDNPKPGGPRRWQLTEREQVGKHYHYWVQAMMVGDPDWRWRQVIGGEMMDHVVVPALTIVPMLTLVMFLTTRSALRPLVRIAAQADEIGAAVSAGRGFTPLAAGRLPREFAAVVAALNVMLGKLDRSLSVQKQFTADVAHELRTPLAVMLLEVAELPDGPERQQLMEELGGLGRLVNEMLRFAQAEDVLASAPEPVNLTAAARKVCEEMAPDAMRRKRAIEFDAPDEPPFVSGNATLIEIAVRNLIENALKFSPNGSLVSVAVEPGGRVVVDDRGPGVADALKAKVFDRFWRVGQEQGGGAGVGLALVRRVANLHGGDAWIEDRPGGGTRAVLAVGAAARMA